MSFYDDASLIFDAGAAAGKDGKAYSLKPTDGGGDFTFTRGSNLTATRVGKDGYIEKGRENLLLQSNNFDTTWSTSNASVTSGQSGYDGSTNAWELKATGDGSTDAARLDQASLSVSGVSTFSVYAKAGNVNWVRVNALNSGTNVNNYFDLSGSGAVGANPSASVLESSITSVGNGWFRISLASKGLQSITEVRIQVAEADEDANPATNSYIYIQDAQLELGLAATAYIENTSTSATATAGLLEDEPRFDYTGGGCPALLMEPTRTNYIEYSEYFNAWTKQGAVTITDNATTSPSGSNDASKYNISASTNRALDQTITLTSGVTYTFSMWVKAIVDTTIRVRSDANDWSEDISLLVSDGWKRIESTHTMGITEYEFGFFDASGSTGDRFYIWGAQLEEGSFATSYMPNYGAAATVTRDSDGTVGSSPSMLTGGYDLSSSWSLFVDANSLKKTGSSSVRFLGLHTSGNYNVQLYLNTSASNLGVNPYLQNNGDYVFGYNSNAAGSEDGFKICLTYDAGTNKISYYINGSLYNSTTSALTFGDETYGYIVGPEYSPTATDASVGLKQILFAPTAFSANDSEILTGATSYRSFNVMRSALNYTAYE
jgi:hypothetical protein